MAAGLLFLSFFRLYFLDINFYMIAFVQILFVSGLVPCDEIFRGDMFRPGKRHRFAFSRHILPLHTLPPQPKDMMKILQSPQRTQSVCIFAFLAVRIWRLYFCMEIEPPSNILLMPRFLKSVVVTQTMIVSW